MSATATKDNPTFSPLPPPNPPPAHPPLPSSSSPAHSLPSGECVFCCEELTSSNFVEYRASLSSPWLPSVYCELCVTSQFIDKQWETYVHNIEAADCAAALKRVITNPPPINVKDAGLPCEAADADGDERGAGEVERFYFHSDAQEHSARLKGSLVGEERAAFWREKKQFLEATEEEEERAKREGGGGGGGVGAAAATVSTEGQKVREEAIK